MGKIEYMYELGQFFCQVFLNGWSKKEMQENRIIKISFE